MLVTGCEILDRGDWAGKWIPVVACLGKEIFVEGRSIYRGAIRHGKDAQRSFNYHRTSTIERQALQPKAPEMAIARIGARKKLLLPPTRCNPKALPR